MNKNKNQTNWMKKQNNKNKIPEIVTTLRNKINLKTLNKCWNNNNDMLMKRNIKQIYHNKIHKSQKHKIT